MARTKRVRASSEDSYNDGPTTQTATPSPPKKARTTEPAAEGTVRKKKARNVRPGNCSNCWCNETETDLWRNDVDVPLEHNGKDGFMVCNACGLWRKDHGTKRPTHLWKHYKKRIPPPELLAKVAQAFGWDPSNWEAAVSTPASAPKTPAASTKANKFTTSPVASTPLPNDNSDVVTHCGLITPPSRSDSESPTPSRSSTYDSQRDMEGAATLIALHRREEFTPPPSPSARHHRRQYIPCTLLDQAHKSRYEPYWVSRDRHAPRHDYASNNIYPNAGRMYLPAPPRHCTVPLPAITDRYPASPYGVVRPHVVNLLNSPRFGAYTPSIPDSVPSLTRESFCSETSLGTPVAEVRALPSAVVATGEQDGYPWGRDSTYESRHCGFVKSRQ